MTAGSSVEAPDSCTASSCQPSPAGRFTGPDGQPDQTYLAAVRRRFGRLTVDTARRFDQACSTPHDRPTTKTPRREDPLTASTATTFHGATSLARSPITTTLSMSADGGASQTTSRPGTRLGQGRPAPAILEPPYASTRLLTAGTRLHVTLADRTTLTRQQTRAPDCRPADSAATRCPVNPGFGQRTAFSPVATRHCVDLP